MNPTFAHPLWIVAGALLLLGGFWLFCWGKRNDRRAEISAPATEAAFNKLRKKPTTKAEVSNRPSTGRGAADRLRNSMAQFLGIVGLLMVIAGIVAMVFGVFYDAG
jgi:predicted lysophospholipase L1 biosynthesis ABC-type transport system permease subunit